MDYLLDDLQDKLELQNIAATKRWQRLKGEVKKVHRLKAHLRDEWAQLREQRAMFEDELQRFKDVSETNFALDKSTKRRVRLNIGGQQYETTDVVLKKDPQSLLAALVSDASPLAPDDEGVVFVDRDGMLFRHVLRFLRDDMLPANRSLLQQLFHEAEYYGLETMRAAIDKRMGLSSLLSSRGGTNDDWPVDWVRREMWWEKPPGHVGWWPTQKAPKKKGTSDKEVMKWWTGDKYKHTGAKKTTDYSTGAGEATSTWDPRGGDPADYYAAGRPGVASGSATGPATGYGYPGGGYPFDRSGGGYMGSSGGSSASTMPYGSGGYGGYGAGGQMW
eukprot:g4073.t1